MTKKITTIFFAVLLLGKFSTSRADVCNSENSCHSMESLYMCAKETNSDIAQYLVADDKTFKKNGDGNFSYAVVERFIDYAKWHEDFQQNLTLLKEHNILREMANQYKEFIDKGESPSQEDLINFKERQYSYYNNLARYAPNGKMFTELSDLENKAQKSKQYLFVPRPKPIDPKNTKYQRASQQVRILNKSFQDSLQSFSRKNFSCMMNFCQTNCIIPSEIKQDKIVKYKKSLNLPEGMDDSDVIKHYITTKSEACLDPTPKGNRQMLLCSQCGKRLVKWDVTIPSCDSLSNNEMYDDKK